MQAQYEDDADRYDYGTPLSTVILIKTTKGDDGKSRVFGGYAHQRWRPDKPEDRYGDYNCFLFSLDQDLRIPYTARTKPTFPKKTPKEPEYDEDGNEIELEEEELPAGNALFCDDQRLVFGAGDLVIGKQVGDAGIGASCKTGFSEVENLFGVGLKRGGQDACIFLAGKPAFDIAALEVWHVKFHD